MGRSLWCNGWGVRDVTCTGDKLNASAVYAAGREEQALALMLLREVRTTRL